MPVKNILVTIIFLILPQLLCAQVDTVKNPAQYVFPDFSVGIVRMTSGEKVVLNLNYNIVTEKMVFIQKSHIYDIINQSTIDTVYINNRRFVPVEKAFYEILVQGPATLFIEHKGAVTKPARPAAYGGTTELASTTYINNLKVGNQVFRMDNKRAVIIKQESIFWVRKDDQMLPVSSSAQMLRALTDKRNEMKAYIRSVRVDFTDPDQVEEAISYYNGLPR
jgi:hypothetical protein